MTNEELEPPASRVVCWLVERVVDGRIEWLSWRGKEGRVWTSDAWQADRYDWSLSAADDARWLTEQDGIECKAVQHLFEVL